MLAGLWGVQFQLPVFWQWLLASLVQFGLGWRFYRGARAAVRAGSSNMDVLVALEQPPPRFVALSMVVSRRIMLISILNPPLQLLRWFGLVNGWSSAKRQTSESDPRITGIAPRTGMGGTRWAEQWLALALLQLGDRVRVRLVNAFPLMASLSMVPAISMNHY